MVSPDIQAESIEFFKRYILVNHLLCVSDVNLKSGLIKK